ncbi:hypothetical protein K402DRAFT_426018, partial [Aulographum hederae CBS 113979]
NGSPRRTLAEVQEAVQLAIKRRELQEQLLQEAQVKLRIAQLERQLVDPGLRAPIETNAANPVTYATNPTHQPRSYLPKPEAPHKYNAKNRIDFLKWEEDCERYFKLSPVDFPDDARKIDFAQQYVGWDQKAVWKNYVEGLVEEQEPTWHAFRTKMLDALGPPELRRQHALQTLKQIKQRPMESPSNLLNGLRSLWAEIQETSRQRQMDDFISALDEPIRDKLSLKGLSTFRSLEEVEEFSNGVWREDRKSRDKTKDKKEASEDKDDDGTSNSKSLFKKRKRNRSPNSNPNGGKKRDDYRNYRNSDKELMTCTYCKKEGHLESKCYSKQNAEKRAKSTQANSGQDQPNSGKEKS